MFLLIFAVIWDLRVVFTVNFYYDYIVVVVMFCPIIVLSFNGSLYLCGPTQPQEEGSKTILRSRHLISASVVELGP